MVVTYTARGVERSVLTAHVPLLPPHLLAELQRAPRLGAYRRVPSTTRPICVMCSARAGEDGGVSAALPLPGNVDGRAAAGGACGGGALGQAGPETFAIRSPVFFSN